MFPVLRYLFLCYYTDCFLQGQFYNFKLYVTEREGVVCCHMGLIKLSLWCFRPEHTQSEEVIFQEVKSVSQLSCVSQPLEKNITGDSYRPSCDVTFSAFSVGLEKKRRGNTKIA